MHIITLSSHFILFVMLFHSTTSLFADAIRYNGRFCDPSTALSLKDPFGDWISYSQNHEACANKCISIPQCNIINVIFNIQGSNDVAQYGCILYQTCQALVWEQDTASTIYDIRRLGSGVFELV